MEVITGSRGFYNQNDTTGRNKLQWNDSEEEKKKEAVMESGIGLHFNYKKNSMRALALCFFMSKFSQLSTKLSYALLMPLRKN